jgi:acetyltransferase-like isoleucine patch superfamily enzyme
MRDQPVAILKWYVTLCQNVTIIGKVTLDPYVNVRENVTLVGPFTSVNVPILLTMSSLACSGRITTCRSGEDHENHCRIGVGSEIIGGVHIGRHVLIRAGSKVIGDIPHYGLASRNPAILERYLA